MEGFKSGELLVKTVISAAGLQAFDGLEELEVDHAGSASNKPLLITKVGDDLRQLLPGLSKHDFLVSLSEGLLNEVDHVVSHNALEHQNLTSLLRVSTEEFWGPFLADVEGDSFGLSDLEITIDHVGKVREGDSSVCLIISPLSSAFLRFDIVNLLGVVDTGEVQNVAVDVTAGSASD